MGGFGWWQDRKWFEDKPKVNIYYKNNPERTRSGEGANHLIYFAQI